MADQVMSRAEAKAQGLKRYHGKPCNRGHSGERHIDGTCVECRLEINRQWAARNPEKKRDSFRRWAEANPEARKAYAQEYHREWYQRNGDAKRAQNMEYQKEHPEASRRGALTWRNKNIETARANANAWYKANPEKRRELGRQKRERKPEVYLAHQSNRRARKLEAPGTHTAADLVAILTAQKHRCAHPGCSADLRKVGKHLDHIMPLSLGGSNDKHNLQYLCPPHNLSKGGKDPMAFAREHGRLL